MRKTLVLFSALIVSCSLLLYQGCGKPRSGEKNASEPTFVVLTDSEILSKALGEAGDLFDSASSNSITVSRQGGFAIVQQTFPAHTSDGLLRAGPEMTTVWIDERTGEFTTPPGVYPLSDEDVLSILREYNPFVRSAVECNSVDVRRLGGQIIATIRPAFDPEKIRETSKIPSPFIYRLRIDEKTREILLCECAE